MVTVSHYFMKGRKNLPKKNLKFDLDWDKTPGKFTWVAIPAWSVPGNHKVGLPLIRQNRVMISCGIRQINNLLLGTISKTNKHNDHLNIFLESKTQANHKLWFGRTTHHQPKSQGFALQVWILENNSCGWFWQLTKTTTKTTFVVYTTLQPCTKIAPRVSQT